MRLTVIDGFRGIFLIFMMIIHANEILNTTFGKLNHHYFGWVEDAQGFVFMSGLVVGLVYGGRYLRYGFRAMQKAIWIRIRTIYSHQIFLIILFLSVTIIFIGLDISIPTALRPYEAEPVLFPIMSAMLVAGSMHMGILPMYIFFMTGTPLALRLLEKKKYATYAAILISCWAITQTRLVDQFIYSLDNVLSGNATILNLGIFFNIFGWQIIFFGGLLIGFLMAAKRLSPHPLASAEMRTVFIICTVLFFFYGIYDRIIFDDWLGSKFSEKIKHEADRGNLSTIYLVTFLIDLFLVFWLLGPGLNDKNIVIRSISQGLHRAAIIKPLVFLGQHSLHVFSAHIIIVYTLAALYQNGPPKEISGIFIILLCIGLLYVAAWIHAKYAARAKAQKDV